MTRELRIRDSYSGLGARGEHGEPPGSADSRLRDKAPDSDPGEAAWNLAEPPSDLTPGPADPEPCSESRDAAPLPFLGFPGLGGEEEEPPKGPGLDVKRLVRGIVKRFWLAAGIAFTIASLFLVIAVTMIKPKWEASAAVMVHTRQDKFSLGGAKPFELQDYNLKTLLDTIKLPSSLLAVSDALKLDAPPRVLSPAIGLTTGKDSNIFQITAVWKDPVVAAGIANKVAELLVQRSRDMRRRDAEDAHANYSAQLESARKELRTVTAEMRAFKANKNVSDFGAETQVLLGSLVNLESDLSTKVAETRALREALANIEKAVEGEPEMVVTSTVYRNPLKTRLTDYEWQLQEARSRYTEENPKVIKLQSRVDVLKQMIAESKDEGAPENLYSANTKLVELQARQRELTDEVRVREAQIDALTQTVERSRAKLADLTAADKDFQLLRARMSSAENLEQGLVGRVDEAKVMMLRNEAAFELFEVARPPTEAAPSAKKLIAVAGVVLGSGIGLVVVLVLELLDPLLRTRRDALGVPGVDLAWEFQQVPPGERAVVDAQWPSDPIAVLFRRLINELDAKLEAEDWRCLGVTSADPQVGRTLVATNLAQALALKEHPVILVDADLRRLAGMHPGDLFKLPPDQLGLLQALRGEAPVTSLLATTETPDLALLAAGTFQSDLALERQTRGDPDARAPTFVTPDSDRDPGWNPDQHATQGPDHSLAGLGSRQFRALQDTLRQTGRHLVYDLPPLGLQETVLEAAASLGNLLLVARSGQTTRHQLRNAAELIEARGAKVRGIMVTDVPVDLLEGAPLFHTKSKQTKKKARRRWFSRSEPKPPAADVPEPQPDPEPHVSQPI